MTNAGNLTPGANCCVCYKTRVGLETRPRGQDLPRRLFWITTVDALLRDLWLCELDAGKVQKLD